MTLDEALKYLDIETLPKAVEYSDKKCIALVERISGSDDYVIARGGGVIADIGFRSFVKRIVEFYPQPSKKEKAIAEEITLEPITPEPEVKAEIVVDTVNDTKSDAEPDAVNNNRQKLISFLVSKRNKQSTLELKSDEELEVIAKRFGYNA